jgi:hypothetical protein
MHTFCITVYLCKGDSCTNKSIYLLYIYQYNIYPFIGVGISYTTVIIAYFYVDYCCVYSVCLIYCNTYVEAARYVHMSLFPPHKQNFSFIYSSPSICLMSIYILTISRYTNRLSYYRFSVYRYIYFPLS